MESATLLGLLPDRSGGIVSARREREEERRQSIIEEVAWLTDCGEHPDRVAGRLGYANADNLATMLDRWGRPGLARRMRRTDERTVAT